MKKISLVSLYILGALFVASAIVFLVHKPAYADLASEAEAFCKPKYGGNTTSRKQISQQSACKKGYQSNSRSVCDTIQGTRQASADDLKSACSAGYQQKVDTHPTPTAPSGQGANPGAQGPNTLPNSDPTFDWCGQQDDFKNTPSLINACRDGAANGIGQNQYCVPRYGAGTPEAIACQTGFSHYRLGTQNTTEHKKCNVQWMGLIICWVSSFIGYVVSGLFAVLTQLMITPPILGSTGVNGHSTLYQTWGIFRNIANLVLVGFLLMIILSYTSNFGLSNYTLKRTAPRLIAGALLINSSFIICQLCVDLSNVVGSTLYGALQNVADTVNGGAIDPDFDFGGTAIVTALTAGVGIALYLNVISLVPMLVAGLIALLTTVVVLVIRQALIIIFVVISPLAFALNILPNTQSWFSKWWHNFMTLLMLFPIISFVFGASKIMAVVVSRGAPDSSDILYVIFIVMALGVQVIPFFFTPLIVRAAGQLTNQLAGMANVPVKAVGAFAQKRSTEWAEDANKVRATNALNNGGSGLYARYQRRKNRYDKVGEYHKDQLKSSSSGAFGKFASSEANGRYLARKLSHDARFGDKLAKKNEIKSAIGNVKIQLDISSVEAADSMLTDQEYTLEQLRESYDSKRGKDGELLTESELAAIAQRIGKEGSLKDIESMIDKLAGATGADKMRENLAKGIAQNAQAKGAAHLDARGLSAIRGGASVGQLYQGAVERGAFNTDTLSKQPSTVLAGLEAHKGSYSAEGLGALRKSRDAVIEKTKYSSRLSAAGRRSLDNL